MEHHLRQDGREGRRELQGDDAKREGPEDGGLLAGHDARRQGPQAEQDGVATGHGRPPTRSRRDRGGHFTARQVKTDVAA